MRKQARLETPRNPAPASTTLAMRDGNDLTSQPRSLLGPVLAGLAAFLVYLLSMAPDLTWANFSSDGGELITASITSGIPHPPGYPTYIFLGKIAALIPIGTVAWRFNFLSAVSAATAVAFITATAQELLPVTKKNQVVAVAGGLCAAFAPLFWGQALVSEVYALNMAILSILLWSLLSGRSSFLSGILLGLATTTHLSSLIMLPLALALSARRRWLHLIAGLLLGLLPFLALPFLARSGSPVIWGDPTTLRGWLWLVSGRIYYANLRLPDPGVFLPRVFQLAGILLRQWLWAGWLIIVLGMTSGLLQKRVILGLVFTALIYFIYGFFYQTEDTILNFIPIILLFSPLLAAGLTRFGVWSLGFPILLLMLNYQSLESAPRAVSTAAGGNNAEFSPR